MAKVVHVQSKAGTTVWIGTEVNTGTATASGGAWLQLPVTDYSFTELNQQTLDSAPFRVGQGVGMGQSDAMVKPKRHDRMHEISLTMHASAAALNRLGLHLFEDNGQPLVLTGALPAINRFKHGGGTPSGIVPVTILFDTASHSDTDLWFMSCMCTNMTISGSIDGDGGSLMLSCTFITGYKPIEGSLTADASDAAVSDQVPVSNIHSFSTTTLGGSGGDLVLHSFELSIARSAQRHGWQASSFDPYAQAVGGFEVTGSLSCKRDGNSLAATAEGSTLALSLTDGTFAITCPAVYVDSPAIDFADNGWLQTIPFRAVHTGAATNAIVTIDTA